MKRADVLTSIHDMPPVDTTLVAGPWHHDRATLKGIGLEARAFLKSLTVQHNANRRFLMLGRARSGTTLLTKLLNAHSQIACDGEVLKRHMLTMAGYLGRLAGKNPASAYGAKFLSYQIAQVHRIWHPELFLETLARSGVLLIHLHRDTFFQTLSLAVAQRRRQYHSDKGARAPQERLWFDPQNFLDRIPWSEALLEYERASLAQLDHIQIVYERDVSNPNAQSTTLDKICAALKAGNCGHLLPSVRHTDQEAPAQ